MKRYKPLIAKNCKSRTDLTLREVCSCSKKFSSSVGINSSAYAADHAWPLTGGAPCRHSGMDVCKCKSSRRLQRYRMVLFINFNSFTVAVLLLTVH